MTTKKAVVTICVGLGHTAMSELTHPTIKAYADRIGADFIVLGKAVLSEKLPQFEKFQLFDLFTRDKYDRIAFLDTDLIVRPDCPDLFEEVPEDSIGAFNEGRFTDTTEVMRDACKTYGITLPKWERQYYNTGVMVLSRMHRKIFKAKPEERAVFGGVSHYEQPYLNIKFVSEGYKMKDLGHKFNRMSLMDTLTGENRLSSYIVHYAGAPFNPDSPSTYETLFSVIKEDLRSWEKNAPSYFYPRNIHIIVGGGIGDQIAAEPVVRYLREKMYPQDNLTMTTHFPVFFKHINIDLTKKKAPGSYVMETLPPPEKPLWQFLAHTLCHSTDYSSISTLRRVLSNKDKQIKLSVDFDAVQSVFSIPGLNMENLILVHPGRGWESKSFPSTYWQAIVDELAKIGNVAIIGKHVSKEQGTVSIVCPDNAIDLRDLLSLEELVAVISMAKILVSNDSAPIHVAGAFDNWIVLIPSCKHPDHILPYRNGNQYHKAEALYKKLTCDALDSSPTLVDGATVDTVLGDILDYLPEVSGVVEAVQDILSKKEPRKT